MIPSEDEQELFFFTIVKGCDEMVTHDARYYVDRHLARLNGELDDSVPSLDSILDCYRDWLGSDCCLALSVSGQ